jgi:serine protease
MSWDIQSTTQVDSALAYADTNGLLLVAAAGNYATGRIYYPARHYKVIAVGATDDNDEHAWYSCWGGLLEVVAPGGGGDDTLRNVVNTWRKGKFDDRYRYWSGTSQATPHVCGVAALIWSVDSTLTNDEVRDIIKYSAEDQVGDNYDTPGHDHYYGYGRINALGAVLRAKGGGTVDGASKLRI